MISGTVGRAIGAMAASILAVGAFVAPAAAQDMGVYVRATIAQEWSAPSLFHDSTCTAAGGLLLLYGCGPGWDGVAPIGARGDFGGSASFETGLGVRVSPFIRIEGVFAFRPGFVFEGNANFPGVGEDQPVTGFVTQASLMGYAFVDLPELVHPGSGIRPFVGVGLGVARNHIDPMLLEFPENKNQPAYTLTPAGTHYGLSWALTAGVGVPLSDRVTLDIAYRLTDHGVVETDEGLIYIRRGVNVNNVLSIEETVARLRSHALMFSLRFAL